MNQRRTPKRLWPLSTKVAAALAIAMLPLGVLAVMLTLRNHAAIGAATPTLVQALAVALPILLWLAALSAGWFAVHRLIVQPLAVIQRAINAYSVEPGRARLGLADATAGSLEIATLAASFDSLADAIDAHSHDLHKAVAEQQRLTREVHHRVKNNLQIVASLLALQARAAHSPDVRQTYASIQARIHALSQVHRWMYDETAGPGVDLKALVADLCAGLEASLISQKHTVVRVTRHLDLIVIHPDAAVPSALLITELASMAAACDTPGTLDISVAATISDGVVTITIGAAGFIGIDRVTAAGTTPTARIVFGLARQLRSPLRHDPIAGSYSVSFDASPG